jgi:hypothetical protein
MRSDYLAGVSVVVREGGRDLQEHITEPPSGAYKTCAAYIESVPAANFTVVITFDNAFAYPREDIEVRVEIDGNYVTGRISRKTTHRHLCIEGVIGRHNGKNHLQRFTFVELETRRYLCKL